MDFVWIIGMVSERGLESHEAVTMNRSSQYLMGESFHVGKLFILWILIRSSIR